MLSRAATTKQQQKSILRSSLKKLCPPRKWQNNDGAIYQSHPSNVSKFASYYVSVSFIIFCQIEHGENPTLENWVWKSSAAHIKKQWRKFHLLF